VTVEEAPFADSDKAGQEVGDKAAPTPAADAATHTQKSARQQRRRPMLMAAVLAVLLVTAATLAVWLYFAQYRPDQRSRGEAQAVTAAATDGAVAILSYSADSVDRDFAAAKSHLTGDFLSYYDNFTRTIVAPAAKQQGLKTTAEVTKAAVSELHPDSAAVLIFVNQTSTSTERPDPASMANSVLVKLTKVDGHWLISSFDPV
jgi:Mce-associated membrane protein